MTIGLWLLAALSIVVTAAAAVAALGVLAAIYLTARGGSGERQVK